MWKKRINLLALCIFSSLDNSVTSTDVCTHIQVQYWPQTTSMQSQIKKYRKYIRKTDHLPLPMNAGPRPRCPAKTGRSGDHSFIEYQKYIEKTNTKNQHQYYMNRLTHKLQITITNWLYTLSFIEETKCNIMLNTYYIRLLTHLLKQFRYNRQLHFTQGLIDWAWFYVCANTICLCSHNEI